MQALPVEPVLPQCCLHMQDEHKLSLKGERTEPPHGGDRGMFGAVSFLPSHPNMIQPPKLKARSRGGRAKAESGKQWFPTVSRGLLRTEELMGSGSLDEERGTVRTGEWARRPQDFPI